MSVWYPCIYCTEDLKCTKNSGDGVISFCVLGPCHDETPSNADRIRVMTDEQLAEWIASVAQGGDGSCAPGCHACNGKTSCTEPWLDWLRQEGE